MEKEMFNELLESIQEMDEILDGKKQASRSFDFLDSEVNGNFDEHDPTAQ